MDRDQGPAGKGPRMWQAGSGQGEAGLISRGVAHWAKSNGTAGLDITALTCHVATSSVRSRPSAAWRPSSGLNKAYDPNLDIPLEQTLAADGDHIQQGRIARSA